MLHRYVIRVVVVTVAMAAALLVAPAAAQEQTVDVELGDFYIDMPTTITEGTITFSLSNVGAMPHTITIEGEGIEVSGDLLSSGQSGSFTAELGPGTYVVYCPVPGHREAGMELTLTVTAAEEPEPTATTAAPTPTTAAPTPTTGGATATVGTGATPTTGTAATATSLPDLPRTGDGGSQGMSTGATGGLLVVVALVIAGAAGAFALRNSR